MWVSITALAGVFLAALKYAPFASALLVIFLVVSAAVFLRWFLRWFARQSKSTRADVIRLIRALRSK